MPDIDLDDHADVLGDPSDYFVHEGRLVVAHATGEPAFAVAEDGTLSPWERPPAAGPAPAPGGSFRSEPGKFAFGVHVE